MASEIVTPLIWEVGAEAYKDRAADGCYPDTGAFTVALQAVAPLIRRAALEEAAAGYDARADECSRDADACDAAGDADNAEVSRSLASHHSLTAAELRALATQEPTTPTKESGRG